MKNDITMEALRHAHNLVKENSSVGSLWGIPIVRSVYIDGVKTNYPYLQQKKFIDDYQAEYFRTPSLKNNDCDEWKVAPKDPDKGHFYASLVKNLLRMIGAGCLIATGINLVMIAGWLWLIAEVFGVIEELV